MNELTNRLTAAAEEMTSGMTDLDYRALRERVSTTSRRLGYRRAAVASAAALAVAAVVVIGGIRLLPHAHQTPAPLGPPSPTPSSAPARIVNPTPTQTPGVPGTLVYISAVPGQPLRVARVTGTDTKVTEFGTAKENERVVVPSPDGRWVAAISSPDPGNLAPGDLTVIEAGGAEHKLIPQVSWGGGVWPLWTVDSRDVTVKLASDNWVLVDPASDSASPAPGLHGEYFAWSANGAYQAHEEYDSTVVVTRPDGTVSSRTPLSGLSECHERPACPFAVQAVSDDGRYVALGHGNTDPSHVTEAHLVLDTRTGRPATLPKVDGDITQIFFRRDGGLVLRWSKGGTYKLSVTGPDFKVTATVPEAQGLPAQALLVAYRPESE
jgi:hypothetical protein